MLILNTITLTSICQQKLIQRFINKLKFVLIVYLRKTKGLFNFKRYLIDYNYSFISRGHINYLLIELINENNHYYTILNGQLFFSRKEFIYILPTNCTIFELIFVGKCNSYKYVLEIPKEFNTGIGISSTKKFTFKEVGNENISNNLSGYFALNSINSELPISKIELTNFTPGYTKQTSNIGRKVLLNIRPQKILLPNPPSKIELI